MEIPTKYNPELTEDKWYSYWMKNNYFHSTPNDKEPFTIVIPPPNVTGVLHMGHMLNNTIQDILIRRARMMGKNALWVPGTDHASIATEAKVVAKLRDEGIKKSDLSRDEFLEHAWEWKEKHGGIILEQLKKLGASCDWDRTCFTMDEKRSECVIDIFIDLFKKGYIYRGVRMVNWDPQAKTALSDEEVIYKEEQSKLYYLKYKIEGEDNQFVTIATTRPETILGDTAVCVNPKDERFMHLAGKRVLVPLVSRSVPIIQDEYVDMEFGTGCLKITPAHDANDYEIGQRHKLETIDIFTADGILNEDAQLFIGKDRFEARKLIVPELEKAGSLAKVEDYANKVGYSERTDVVIEPRLSAQWFIAMKELIIPALENVMNDTIEFFPKKFKNVYRHWMDNIKDWCISRQLWWGHRIPVYYLENGDYVVAKSIEEAVELAQQKTGNKNITAADLHQDEDVLDTWASSWLWPMSVFNDSTENGKKELDYYYPTSVLVTGHDIIFFWVARMIIAGYFQRNEKPFNHVYFTGMVRDNQRRKMSKSLGNSPDPLELIKDYSADGVRVGMLLCSPAGGDLLFDTSLTEQGRNFTNKIWNAFRLVKSWQTDENLQQPKAAQQAIEWFGNKLNKTIDTISRQYDEYRLSEALMSLYKLFWDDFSSWYLEAIKPPYGEKMDTATYQGTIAFFDKLMKLLHPFMPFITEEIWQLIEERAEGESIMVSEMPAASSVNEQILENFEFSTEVISKLRTLRKEKNIPQKEQIHLQVLLQEDTHELLNEVIQKTCNLSTIDFVKEKPEGAFSFIVKTSEFFVPISDNLINKEEELERLQKELDYNLGFLKTVDKKLGNERFVNNAPEKVVEAEKKKKSDAESKIKALEEQIKALK